MSTYYEEGKKAHDQGLDRAPVSNPKFDLIFATDQLIKAMDLYLAGWDDARQVLVQQTFPEMYAEK